ncbi:Asp23/Gls24 family envelope stress response protein [Oceanobacillus saliphilus]|uniref:Asp23/Gls24 family envelope stress response protein n=1 Tax=Oceanobacillus saliphilus TaxID=2925834 RepID=UPI00201E4921|nr:Asp23/Gls24 family envelope stress response protein [Oceanobacillus saliphilus]
MSEQPILEVSDNTALGRVEIAPEVIEVIAGISATEVEGLYAMRGNFASGVAERLGKKAHSKGVKVELTDDGVAIDIYVILNFGVSIPQVAQELQSNIRQTLETMTAIALQEVNVHVVGIHMEGKEYSEAEE